MKKNTDGEVVATKATKVTKPEEPQKQNENEYKRPKSRKELRAERRALQKAGKKSEEEPRELSRAEKKVLRKEDRKAVRKEQRLEAIREQKKEKRLRKQKRLRREMNAPGGANAQNKKLKRKHQPADTDSGEKKEKKQKSQSSQNRDFAMNVYNDLFNGTHDDASGTTTLRMGVKYKDAVEGKGPMVEDRMLVNVSYKLKGGKYGAVLDSSKNFSFRVGRGEVIKGWDIGVVGMRVGGRRHLIVPPKAGYGSDDIGAGPGATLFFDITLLSMR